MFGSYLWVCFSAYTEACHTTRRSFTVTCWCTAIPAAFSFTQCLFRVAEYHPDPPMGLVGMKEMVRKGWSSPCALPWKIPFQHLVVFRAKITTTELKSCLGCLLVGPGKVTVTFLSQPQQELDRSLLLELENQRNVSITFERVGVWKSFSSRRFIDSAESL